MLEMDFTMQSKLMFKRGTVARSKVRTVEMKGEEEFLGDSFIFPNSLLNLRYFFKACRRWKIPRVEGGGKIKACRR